jgi:hypothetical protein
MKSLRVRILVAVGFLAAVASQALPAESRCGVHVTFQRHENSTVPSVTSGPWALMIVGEMDRRGGERTVIVERFNGERETIATWDTFAERWVTPDGQLWEDVRSKAVCGE